MTMLCNPKVSVIVPCYNQEDFVEDTLESIRRQSYKNIECIIINDGSSDGSLNRIIQFCSKDSRFSYIDKNNEGVAVARNTGISHSSGKYILPVDADDIIAEDYIKECVTVLESHPEIKVVYCRAQKFGEVNYEWILPPYSLETELCRNCIFCSAMFKKDDFDKSQGYNPNMKEGFEDWDFWISFLGHGEKVYKIDKILFYYRIKKISRNNSFNLEARKRLRRQMWENNKEVFSRNYFDLFSTPEYLSAYNAGNVANRLKNSLDFRIGHFILKPFRFVKRIISSL